jgi:hypothetical protein
MQSGVEALSKAVRSNDARKVREVLTRFPELKASLDDEMVGGHFGATPLLTAVNQGNREMVDVLLEAGATINQRSHWWAGSFGVLDNDGDLHDFLIQRGARIDAHAAARLGKLDLLRELVAKDPAVVHARGGDGQLPLHFAASTEVAAFLLDHGADINAIDVDHESTAAQWMVKERSDVARYLVGRGCRTDILLGAALGDESVVRTHLAQDAAAAAERSTTGRSEPVRTRLVSPESSDTTTSSACSWNALRSNSSSRCGVSSPTAMKRRPSWLATRRS